MSETTEPSCLRCGSDMERGFLIDHTYGAKLQAKWAAGKPQYRFGGMMMKTTTQMAVVTCRCTACGHLESFAGNVPDS